MSYFMLNAEKATQHTISAMCDGGILLQVKKPGNRNPRTLLFGN